jgi:RNA polymerase sigma factor (sigma-70 family)
MNVAPVSWPRFLRPLLPVRPSLEGSDAQLLERFVQRRDEDAFAALMERHGPMVLGVCRRVLRNPLDAEDVFQATFLVLVQKAAALRRPELLGNWLYGVAYRIALQARASAARWQALERQVENMPAPEPVDEKAWQELRPILDEEIARLPEKYRVPVVLCYLEGKTYTEAARMLGWAEGTVSGRLARAREKLRTRLALRGLTLSAAVLATTVCQKSSAAVPTALALATLKGALLTTTGQVAAELISAKAAAFSQGALRAAFAGKLKLLAVFALIGVVGTAAWIVTQSPAVISSRLHVYTQRLLDQDKQKLQGTWHCVAVQTGGRAVAPKSLSLSFQGNQVAVQAGEQELAGTYQLSLFFIHRRINVSLPAGSGRAPATLSGSYSFKNDTLSLTLNHRLEGRSQDVDATSEDVDVRYDFQRQR